MNRNPLLLIASLLLASCGGAVISEDNEGSEGEKSAAGRSGPCGAPLDPCASKRCGDVCSLCAPGDPACAGALVAAYCDASGACAPGVPMCGDPCSNDADCGYGVEWCDGGHCVSCDSTGGSCGLSCPPGQALYERNGCSPCACAPVNECIMDGDCPAPPGVIPECYAGDFCWDWCPPGEPSCCYGNTCSAPPHQR